MTNPADQLKTTGERLQSFEGKMAEKITEISGSMSFVYIHVIWFASWVTVNHGLLQPFIPIFDPFPYGLLTMIVSLEAIFLSTFIMVAQNRQALIDTVRDIEDEIEEKEEAKDIEDIQEDLDDLKRITANIQKKLNSQNNATKKTRHHRKHQKSKVTSSF